MSRRKRQTSRNVPNASSTNIYQSQNQGEINREISISNGREGRVNDANAPPGRARKAVLNVLAPYEAKQGT